MPKRKNLNNRRRKSELSSKSKGKLLFLFLMFIIAFAGLGTRVFFIKEVHGEEYETAAKTQQVNRYDSVIPPNRGAITDRNNQTLAVSTTVYNIILDVRVLVTYSQEEQEKTIKALSEALEGVEYETLKDYITIVDPENNTPKLDTSYKILAKKQPREVKEALEAQELKGVVYEKDSKRKYPGDTLASHVIGFVRDSMWGLEKEYNSYMSGVSGRAYITFDGAKGAVEHEIPAEDGCTVVTTLDYTMQTFAEEAVENMVAEYNPENAAAMIMDPNTGEILAMASSPNFNLNDPANPIALSTDESFKERWEAMTPDEQVEYLNNTWTNFNITSTFEPGSIYKPIVVAAALEEGVISPTDTYYCSGSKQVADRTIGCHLRSGHGTQTVEQVLANSCNVGMMDIAAKMGVDMMYKYQKDFGFGQLTGIDLPREESAKALLHAKENIGVTELATMSFGQGFNATAIQALNAMAAVINGGSLMKPYIVSQVVDRDGNIVKENKPEVVRKVISKETSDIVREQLVSVVENGTGKKARIEGYKVGGKTGTAEQNRTEPREYTVSFIGYLPADNPQYIAITLIHKPEHYQDGVTTVAPEMKRLMENIIKYKSIEPNYEVEGSGSNDENTTTVYDYTGSSLPDVLNEISGRNLDYEIVGTGNLVVNQVPHGITEVSEGTKVILYVEKDANETGTIAVPNVKGMSYGEAVTEIVDAGLTVDEESGETDGVVVSTTPSIGVTVEEGTSVILKMEKKEEPEETG